MKYDKSIAKVCAHCGHSADFSHVYALCHKKGPVSYSYKCRHFKYDPLRRKPPKPVQVFIPSKESLTI